MVRCSGRRPKPGNLAVKLIYLLDLPLRPVNQVQVLLALVGRLLILLLALSGLGRPGNIVVPDVDRTSEVVNRTQHARDSVAVALVSECDNLLCSLAIAPARHVRVG